MQRIKITITSLLLLLTMATSAYAVKASGKAVSFKQPDGTTLMVRLIGDEYHNWYQTTDGILLVKKDNAYYIAKTNDDGTLGCTDLLAHNIDKRGEAEQTMAKAQQPDLFHNPGTTERKGMMKGSGYPRSGRCPHKGKVKIPVIMMEYPDLPFSYSKDELYSVFNGFFNSMETKPFDYTEESFIQGYGSVRRYFYDASHGNFDPEFVLYGPYMANKESTAYGNHKGLNAATPLKLEAIQKADDDINFRDYDSDGDGNVDMVYVLYAGHGANIGDHDTAIWPQCNLSNYSADGMTINVLGMSNELTDSPLNDKESTRAGIGVFCHEFSHGLGLPDLYWTLNYAPTDIYNLPDYNNCGPEDWDLMDGGENIGSSIWPVQYAAWEKEAMGWIELEELKEPQNVTIYPFDDPEGRGKACVVRNPADRNEYYVIENFMSSRNSWNYYYWVVHVEMPHYIPGLIVTHVSGMNGESGTMTPNLTYKQPKITLLPADGFILAAYSIDETCWYHDKATKITSSMYYRDLQGDPYPGMENVCEILKYNNYKDFKDMGTRYPITDITMHEDRSISFKFMGGIDDGIEEITADNTTSGGIYTMDGRLVGHDAEALPKGLYIINGRKVINR